MKFMKGFHCHGLEQIMDPDLERLGAEAKWSGYSPADQGGR